MDTVLGPIPTSFKTQTVKNL